MRDLSLAEPGDCRGRSQGYEVFVGNRADVTTVEEIVGTMEARYGEADRGWVMDRGMTSAENVAWLQETQRRYLIGTPKSELRKWARQIAEAKDWKTVRDGERLGHSTVGITLDTYSHVLPSLQEEAAQKVDAAIRAAIKKLR